MEETKYYEWIMDPVVAVLLLVIVILAIVLVVVLRGRSRVSVDIDERTINRVTSEVATRVHEVANEVLITAGKQLRDEGANVFQQQRETLKTEAEKILQPFEERMSALGDQVEKLREDNSKDKVSIDDAIGTLSKETSALAKVLANPRARGAWGERMLEDVLERTGLQRGINYEKQEDMTDGIPDYSFFLPMGRVVYLDSKFPADNYLKYFEASDEVSRAAHLDGFKRNVKKHVDDLSKKNYPQLKGRESVDYVLAFIPNESVMGFIQQHVPTQLDDALAKRVVMCSPLTLYAFLMVIRQATESYNVEQKADQILELYGRFSQAWVHYVTNVKSIWKAFQSLEDGLRKISIGKVMQNLQAPLREIEELRTKAGIEASEETLRSVREAFEIDGPEDGS